VTDEAGARWTVLVPVKRLPLAKTRLAPAVPAAPGAPTRAELALALATDAVTAALACDRVARVLVITSDPVAGPALAARGADVVPDLPEAGLDEALRHAAERARADDPGCGVAALSADLPALTPAGLGAALDAAAGYARAVVADAAGGGTVLLTAGPGAALAPSYGAGSFARHVALGAVPLDPAARGLRLDVDTPVDLAEAARIGLGPATAALLPRLAPGGLPPG
jgi:2-phospho-L-lactate guanylyltransferase